MLYCCFTAFYHLSKVFKTFFTSTAKLQRNFPPIPKFPWSCHLFKQPGRVQHVWRTSAWWRQCANCWCEITRFTYVWGLIAEEVDLIQPFPLQQVQTQGLVPALWKDVKTDEAACVKMDERVPRYYRWIRLPRPQRFVLFYNKMCFNQSSQYVFSPITCFWPAEQTFPLWAEGVTGGVVWCSFTCLIQEGMWDCGSENTCSRCDLWTPVFCRRLQPFPRPAEMKTPRLSRALTNQEAASLTHPQHAAIPNKHPCSIIMELYMTRPAPPPR